MNHLTYLKKIGLLFFVGIVVVLVYPKISSYLYVAFGIPFVRMPWQAVCPDCNVVLVSLDTLRADDISCYGYYRNTAPNLCSFGTKNNYFTRFYSQSSYTLDSHFSIMTGMYPSTHHVTVPFTDILHSKIPTLAEILHKRGYKTVYAGVTTDPSLPLDRGLERGFDVTYSIEEYGNEWVSAYKKLLPLLDGKKPSFLFLHTYWTHAPYLTGHGKRLFTLDTYPSIALTQEEYEARSMDFFTFARNKLNDGTQSSGEYPSKQGRKDVVEALQAKIASNDANGAEEVLNQLNPFDLGGIYFAWYQHTINDGDPQKTAYARSLYDERIHSLDSALQPLLTYVSQQKIKRKTIVIITSDHGEEFNEHGRFDHDYNVYLPTTHIPLFIAVPRLSQGEISSLAQSVDIFPTVLSLLGLTSEVKTDGRSLLNALQKGSIVNGDPVVVSEHGNDLIRSVFDGRMRLYVNKLDDGGISRELYDVKTDPLEQNNRIDNDPATADTLEKTLKTVLGRSPVFPRVNTGFPDWIDPKKREDLIKRGYF